MSMYMFTTSGKHWLRNSNVNNGSYANANEDRIDMNGGIQTLKFQKPHVFLMKIAFIDECHYE